MAGRPREFDRDLALEKARDLFWARGYEGTSMSDLVAALGIASARIYAAFGSKEALPRSYRALRGERGQLCRTCPIRVEGRSLRLGEHVPGRPRSLHQSAERMHGRVRSNQLRTGKRGRRRLARRASKGQNPVYYRSFAASEALGRNSGPCRCGGAWRSAAQRCFTACRCRPGTASTDTGWTAWSMRFFQALT